MGNRELGEKSPVYFNHASISELTSDHQNCFVKVISPLLFSSWSKSFDELNIFLLY